MRRVKHKSRGISVMTAFVCLAFVVVAVLCATRMYDVHQRRQRLEAENQQLLAQRQALIERNNELQAQNMRGRDTSYIESQARAQLDMVYPGEIIFRTSGE